MRLFWLFIFMGISTTVFAQKASITKIKKALDTSANPIGYTKYVLKKSYKIDTIAVFSSTSFIDKTDSLAYYGKEGKVYGPYYSQEHPYLVKILGKAPNTFYHISHIQLDTLLFRGRYADSLADTIISRIQSGVSTFETMATLYSSDRSSFTKGGDMGWFSRGAMLPQLDRAIALHKKGEVFKVRTAEGIHIIKITDNPRQDVGFALILKVFL